eukprot:1140194-Pelagomonas_calceolata.AAC.1
MPGTQCLLVPANIARLPTMRSCKQCINSSEIPCGSQQPWLLFGEDGQSFELAACFAGHGCWRALSVTYARAHSFMLAFSCAGQPARPLARPGMPPPPPPPLRPPMPAGQGNRR